MRGRLTTGRTLVAPAEEAESPMYKAVTRGISVTVTPASCRRKILACGRALFLAYAVEIINLSVERVQLRSRYWKIVDGRGAIQEVRGAGVVGKQPVLGPGESFSYTSGCADDAERHHAGHLRHGHGDRRNLRRQDSRLLPR